MKIIQVLIFLIRVKLLVLLPIEDWKTKLKGKCSCFENLFGRYPAKIQYPITQNLKLNEKDECIPIDKDIDI